MTRGATPADPASSGQGRSPGRTAARLWMVLGALVVAPLACGGSPARSDATPVGASSAELHPAVDFEFDSIDERPVSSAVTRGKPTVLAFVTTGSLMSQAQVDFLVAMAKHDADRVNYALVALEQRQNRELVQLYQKALGVSFPVALADATTLEGAGAFGDVTQVPVTVVLDRTGRIVLRAVARVVKSEEIRAAMRGL
jgi:hypothetical protein